MRIGTDNSIKRTEKSASASRAKQTDSVFSIASAPEVEGDDASVEETSSLAPSFATGGLGSLLSLQEVQLDKPPNQQAYDYGKGLLLQLRNLQTELLAGGVSLARLDSMQNLMRQNRAKAVGNPALDNPALQDIITQIETRIAIEMAKYGRDIQLKS